MRRRVLTIGVILGAVMVFGGFAEDRIGYYLERVTYSLYVNETAYEGEDLPVLNYEGNTYVPLRAIGNLCGATIEWRDYYNSVKIDTLLEDTPYLNEEAYMEGTDERELIKIVNKSIEYHNAKDIDQTMALFQSDSREYMRETVLESFERENKLVRNVIRGIYFNGTSISVRVEGISESEDGSYDAWWRDYVFIKEEDRWWLLDIH